jgi:hypothetical protein
MASSVGSGWLRFVVRWMARSVLMTEILVNNISVVGFKIRMGTDGGTTDKTRVKTGMAVIFDGMK